MDSTPTELKPYLEAEKIRQKRKDAELWQAGIYETSATFTAVANGKLVTPLRFPIETENSIKAT